MYVCIRYLQVGNVGSRERKEGRKKNTRNCRKIVEKV